MKWLSNFSRVCGVINFPFHLNRLVLIQPRIYETLVIENRFSILEMGNIKSFEWPKPHQHLKIIFGLPFTLSSEKITFFLLTKRIKWNRRDQNLIFWCCSYFVPSSNLFVARFHIEGSKRLVCVCAKFRDFRTPNESFAHSFIIKIITED